MHSASEIRTSQAELLGTTTGMILTAVVAILDLGVLLGMVFLADGLPPVVRSKIRRGGASGGPAGEISNGQGDRPWEQIGDRHVAEGGYPHGKPADPQPSELEADRGRDQSAQIR